MSSSALWRFKSVRILSYFSTIILACVLAHRFALFFDDASRFKVMGWQDEGYVWYPVEKIYDEGFSKFRCRENNPVGCYGSTQAFIDAAFLMILPNHLVEKEKIVTSNGTRWFYNPKYPHGARLLRFMRVICSPLICILIVLLGIRLGYPKALSIAFGLSLSSYYAFWVGWQGLKNDLPLNLWMLAFLYISVKSLKNPSSLKLWLFSIAIGILGNGVKLTLLLPFSFFLLIHFIQFFRQIGFDRTMIFRFLISGLFLSIGMVLVLYPNIWISTSESSWFLIFLFVGGGNASWSQRWFEFTAFTWKQLWPLLGLLIPLGLELKNKKRISIESIYISAVAIVLTYLVWSGAKLRATYYLPILVWIYAGILISGKGSKYREYFVAFMLGAGLISAALGISQHGTPVAMIRDIREIKRMAPIHERVSRQVNEAILNPNITAVILDRSIRAGIIERPENSKIIEFDSLSDSPGDLISKISILNNAELAKGISFFIPCWSYSEPKAWDIVNPNINLWAKYLSKKCKRTEEFSRKFSYAFESGGVPDPFFETFLTKSDIDEWKNLKSGKIPLGFINPRILNGNQNTLDYWFSPVNFYKDTEISGDLYFESRVSRIELEYESTCKTSGGDVAVSVSSIDLKNNSAGQKKMVSGSIDVRDKTCDRYPWVCRLGLTDWWMKRFSLKPLKIELDHPQRAIRIDIQADGLYDPNRCRVSLMRIVAG